MSVKTKVSEEIRIHIATSRYSRLLQLAQLLGQTPQDIVKLSVDYYYNTMLISGAFRDPKKDS